jgi:hypothetical protein
MAKCHKLFAGGQHISSFSENSEQNGIFSVDLTLNDNIPPPISDCAPPGEILNYHQ